MATRFSSEAPAASGGGEKPKSGEIKSPSSFEDAWLSGFFDPESREAVESLGFSINDIPNILAIPLGGRLGYCVHNWDKIEASDWVSLVVSKGYKIPFESFPNQTTIPENPDSTGEAYNILDSEAKELFF